MTDGIGQSYLWVQSTVHDGPAVEDGHIFLAYTQLEDPAHKGYYESFTCQTVYRREQDFADPETVIVRNYYGKGRFAAIADDADGKTENNGFMDINFEDLVDNKNSVWRADTVNAFSSFRSSYDAEMNTSSQTCTALRAVDDTTNFAMKAGSYKFIQGYRVYQSS